MTDNKEKFVIYLPKGDSTLMLGKTIIRESGGKAIMFDSDGEGIFTVSFDNQILSAYKFFGEVENGNFKLYSNLLKKVDTNKERDAIKEAFEFLNKGMFLLPGKTGVDLTNPFVYKYSKLILNQDITIIDNPENLDVNNNDIILNYNGHYSSIPKTSSILNIEGQRYIFDTLGNKHQNSDGVVKTEISNKFPNIQPLNPFGLDYQNNSNACGIWSANILHQINEFKKAGREKEIIQTYNDNNGNKFQILNPEILLKATVQVSKDLTLQGQKLELKILQDGHEPEQGYVKLKIGDTTFAMDTTYRPNSCIDIQAIALSIPKKELIKCIGTNKDFMKKQDEIEKELNGLENNEQNERRKRAMRVSYNKRVKSLPSYLKPFNMEYQTAQINQQQNNQTTQIKKQRRNTI